jgi:hypothetical protein
VEGTNPGQVCETENEAGRCHGGLPEELVIKLQQKCRGHAQTSTSCAKK